jgi:hypothetical protein
MMEVAGKLRVFDRTQLNSVDTALQSSSLRNTIRDVSMFRSCWEKAAATLSAPHPKRPQRVSDTYCIRSCDVGTACG